MMLNSATTRNRFSPLDSRRGSASRRRSLPRRGPAPSGNTNNDLDWHIDKDELEGRRSGRFLLPLLSTVFYPHVSCAGGELLVADSPPIQNGYQGRYPHSAR